MLAFRPFSMAVGGPTLTLQGVRVASNTVSVSGPSQAVGGGVASNGDGTSVEIRDSVIANMRDEHSTFGWVMERMLAEVGFELVSADYHAPLHGTYLLQKPKSNGQG